MNTDPRLTELCERMARTYHIQLDEHVLVNTVNKFLRDAKDSLKHDGLAHDCGNCISIGDYSGRGGNGRFNIALGDHTLEEPVAGSYWLDYFGLRFNYRHLLVNTDIEPTLENVLARQLTP